MVNTKVEFNIYTDGPVTDDEIAHAIYVVFQRNAFPYRKPGLISTTVSVDGVDLRRHTLADIEGEPIGMTHNA